MMKSYADKSTQTEMKSYADKSTQTEMKSYADKSTQTDETISGTASTMSASDFSSEPSDFEDLMEAIASTSSVSASILNKLQVLSTKREKSPTASSSLSKKTKVPKTSVGNKKNVYKFKVQLKHTKKTYRIILLKGASSLHELAEAITSAFDFDMDHAFAFYNDVSQDTSTATYTLWADMGYTLDPEEKDDKSVARSYIYEVFQPRDKWLFYYDYGDSWEFLVECQDDKFKADPGAKYPQVIKKNGAAPPQYNYGDEDTWD